MAAAARIALATAALVTIAVPLTARHAMAASPADTAGQDDRSDRTEDQEDAIDAAQDAAQARQVAGQPAAPAPTMFNFRVNAPLNYNSNAAETLSGEPAALEGDPEIELGWTRRLTSVPLRLSVKLRADTDRFANVPQANEDEVSESIKAAYYDANDDQAWAPFVSYKNTALFEATFGPWTETRNDFAIGFDKIFYFDGNFHWLPTAATCSIRSPRHRAT